MRILQIQSQNFVQFGKIRCQKQREKECILVQEINEYYKKNVLLDEDRKVYKPIWIIYLYKGHKEPMLGPGLNG